MDHKVEQKKSSTFGSIQRGIFKRMSFNAGKKYNEVTPSVALPEENLPKPLDINEIVTSTVEAQDLSIMPSSTSINLDNNDASLSLADGDERSTASQNRINIAPVNSKSYQSDNESDDEESIDTQELSIMPSFTPIDPDNNDASLSDADHERSTISQNRINISPVDSKLYHSDNETDDEEEAQTGDESIQEQLFINLGAVDNYSWYLDVLNSSEMKVSCAILIAAGLLAISLAFVAGGVLGAAANILLVGGTVAASVGAIGLSASLSCSFFATNLNTQAPQEIDELTHESVVP